MSGGFACRIAATLAEREDYFALRRAIFCAEQGLFDGSDRDAIDAHAVPIVCVAEDGRVVGVVRIWQDDNHDRADAWWGGRLGVHPAFRGVGSVGTSIGRALIETAVGTARAWGATRFRATVQRPNVPLFRRLHWRSIEELDLLGVVHHLMQVDLERYPPLPVPRPPAFAPGVDVEAA